MKLIVHHFHAQPPHHGARYYLGLAALLLIPAAIYALVALWSKP